MCSHEFTFIIYNLTPTPTPTPTRMSNKDYQKKKKNVLVLYSMNLPTILVLNPTELKFQGKIRKGEKIISRNSMRKTDTIIMEQKMYSTLNREEERERERVCVLLLTEDEDRRRKRLFSIKRKKKLGLEG